MKYFDSHVHFDEFVQEDHLKAVLDTASESGVCRMLAVGGSASANQLSLKLANEYMERIFGCVGYDRDEATKEPDFGELRDLANNPLVSAVGETGLDYYYSAESSKEQQQLFEFNLSLAVEFEKPVVVHTRDADDDTLAILRTYATDWKGAPDKLGVLHCFTRDKAFARQILDLGLMISFSGIVTFRNADMLREVAKYVPLDRIMVETDSPYLAPIPKRGERNEPANVVHVVKLLAELRGCSIDSMADMTAGNAAGLFC